METPYIAMSQRIVKCSKFEKELPGLEAPPVGGELGDEIFEKVSVQAWNEWCDDVMIKIINEYRLDLIDDEQYGVLMQQMRAFLNLDQG